MRKNMLTISAVLLLSFLTACDMASGISTVENSVSTTENSINSAENKQEDGGGIEGQDWRTWGTIDGYGNLSLDGQDIDVCACVFGDRVELYYDEPKQNLFLQVDYPEKLTNEQYEKATVEFDDYNDDGNTDVRIIVGEEDSPEMWWTFVWDKDDFVYMAALAYPPTEVKH